MARVLVVDDNAANRALVVTLLKHRHHEAFEAADGAEALTLAAAVRPQLIISDILMPTMDGFEFVRRLRATADLAAVTVIFYTAHYREREARSLAASCGVSDVLMKPCEPEVILQTIDKALLSASGQIVQPTEVREFDREHLRLMTDKLAEKAGELHLTNLRLTALTELNLQLSSEREPHTLLTKVCRGARDFIGAKYAVLGVRDKTGGATTFVAVSGLDVATLGPLSHPSIDSGLLGEVLFGRQARRQLNPGGDPTKLGLPAGYPPAAAVLAAPITSLAVSYGWICLVDKLGAGEFSVQDERELVILGAQVGRIYENGSLYVEVQQRAAQLKAEMVERARTTAELEESEQRFRQLAEQIQDVFWISSADRQQMVYVSPAYERIWGRSRDALRTGFSEWLQAVYPQDRSGLLVELQKPLSAGESFQAEYRIVKPDGSIRWILDRGYPVFDSQGLLYRVVGVARDITERRESRAKIEHLNRVYAVLSGINSLIVRVQDRQELFREACRLAVEQGRFELAWIGWLETDSGRIKPMAWASADENFAPPSDNLHGDTIAPAQSLVAKAVISKQPEICNDIAAATLQLRYDGEMLKRGYYSAAALPLIIGDQAVGVLALYTSESGFFNDAEMRLLTELAGDISFALDHIEKAERLDFLAYYDSLTGLANRTLFQERISQQLKAAERSSHQLAVVVVDLERFGTINDTLGRHAGDQLLKQLADRLVQSTGDANANARIDATHLAVLLSDLQEEGEILQRINGWWEQCFGPAFAVDATELRLAARVGIAIFPDDGDNAEILVVRAEAALKNAHGSTDKYLFYTHQIGERVAEKLTLETQLRQALEKEELVLYYQPKVDLETRRMEGAEALMRWQSPSLGLVAPAHFIPLMEETGMIVEAGAWALRQAILDRSRWLERKMNAPRVAVNVSTVQLRRADFVRVMAQTLRLGGAEAGIDIEVTESLIMDDVDGNIEKLKAIRELGVGIAIDDFGTGYSSLGYLTRLPVQVLKIDRTFIMTMLDDPSTMTLVSTMISLAHALKLIVVAEGVETEEQAKILRLLRCDQMQGYLVSKPLSFDEMTARLARGRN